MIDFFKKHSLQNGFTLIEASIIILIMGLIMGPFFQFLSAQYKKEQLVIQEENLEKVTVALGRFVAENGFYPCPADSTLGSADANFGMQACPDPATVSAGSCSDNVCVYDGVDNNVSVPLPSAKDTVYIGALPTTALRLSPELAANKHGWKYRYAVSADLTNDTVNGVLPVPGAVGNITVWVDTDDDNVTGLNDAGIPLDAADESFDQVKFVVVDLGKDGKGAHNLDGQLSPFACSATAGDYRNCNPTIGGGTTLTEFRDKSYASQGNVNAGNHFDDTLIYTLARQESTFWEIDDVVDDGVNVTLRDRGNMGIGTSAPSNRLHIVGKNISARSGSTIQVENMEVLAEPGDPEAVIELEQNFRAGNAVGGNMYYPAP